MNQGGRLSKGVLITLCVVLVGAVLGVVGYWLGTREAVDQPAQSTPQTQSETSEDSASDISDASDELVCDETLYQRYRNESIDLEFCYPNAWGATNLTPPQGSASVAGDGYEIAFSAYDAVVSSITADYQNTIGRGGRCEDPTKEAPDFMQYRIDWVEESSEPGLELASRYHIKSDGRYLVSEIVSAFSSDMCFEARINHSGSTYPVVKVVLRRPIDGTSVPAHVANPEALFSAEERTALMAVVESVQRTE